MAQRNNEIEEQRERFLSHVNGKLLTIMLTSTAGGIFGTLAYLLAQNAEDHTLMGAVAVSGVVAISAAYTALKKTDELYEGVRCYMKDPREYFKKYHGNQEF